MKPGKDADPMKQDAFTKIDVIESEIEAQLLGSILNEREIPHHIQSYHDTAYDGLYQTQKGWGQISAPAVWSEEIQGILSEIRTAAASP
ncbi:MAG: hypothetical protein PVJ62_04170 [Deltaproteobacteria bacterium]|jgi:hypothetical protein